MTIGAAFVELAIADLATRRVFAGAQSHAVRCGVAAEIGATALGTDWAVICAAPVAAATALTTAAAAGSAAAGAGAAGVASVGAAPAPNAAGSMPTLLSTTGGVGAVAAVFAAAFGVAGWRFTRLVTMGTRWVPEAERGRAWVAKGALTVEGFAVR